jgi:hypothetical protein|tara:strand:+ start:431 stop:1027 length:597 start_codon:yes stop_codon:yes gene_type:complete
MSGSIKLKHASGNGVIIAAPSSNPAADRTITLPSTADGTMLTTTNPKTGNILQVVQSLKNDVFTSSVQDTFTDITGMSVNITPTSSSNKILVSVNLNISNGTAELHVLRLLRDSTAIGASNFATTNGFALFDSESENVASRGIGHVKAEILDSPATTSQITYKVQFFKNGSANMHVNRRALNTGAGATSQITVYEVAG